MHLCNLLGIYALTLTPTGMEKARARARSHKHTGTSNTVAEAKKHPYLTRILTSLS